MGYSGAPRQDTTKYNGTTWSNAGNTGNAFYNPISDGNDSSAIEVQGTTGGTTKTAKTDDVEDAFDQLFNQ